MEFGLQFLVMDPGYHPDNRRLIEENARRMNIPIHICDSDIFDIVVDVDQSPCYLCARMRRGYLYSHAKELGCNKIALGHHFDDAIETTLIDVYKRQDDGCSGWLQQRCGRDLASSRRNEDGSRNPDGCGRGGS